MLSPTAAAMSVPPARPPAPTDQRKLAMAASLAVAVLMLVGKLAAYVITGSTAILSDAAKYVVGALLPVDGGKSIA